MCTHTLTGLDSPLHVTCPCCNAQFMGFGVVSVRFPEATMSTTWNVCTDCFEKAPERPKPVSFRNEVVEAGEAGTCMFCSNPAANFKFATGEFICERCVR